ncbi:uncharacterized protein K460DRAFT_400617 [Cucurbitaria berberidis CBS 394.84]|uniref:Uncharacterized protein n=1 Tax=Cucurbitaria berberidis CBS 394.84 TaxID=1168544 RepID=A0A9P4GRS3_9PLEO|nr:uncharacterized protein K460DRAFT_400617 [Cucurbitaria berberidis CBS 394.84]KAF1850560.1 hypothetical protein K460DRAFT_400617 [Cucurbitaria berberidis CBS 394.84]
MTALKTADELYNDLKSKEMLQGWDMLIAYRQKEVNEMLVARHTEILSKNPAWNLFSFEVPFDDEATHEKKIKKYDIKYETPTLSFLSSNPQQIQLLFKCSGSWVVNQVGANPWIFPDDCYMRCVTDFIHVVGDVGAGDMKPATSNQVGLTESGTTNQSHVAINLPKCVAQFVNGKGEPIIAMNIGGGDIALRDFISRWGFKYHLTGVSTTAPDATTTKLIPKQFVMTLYIGNDAESSALLMWINLEGLNMAGHMPDKKPDNPGAPNQLPSQSRQSTLLFTLDGQNEIFPLPKDSNAAVYISYDAFFVKLIRDHMTASGYMNIAVEAKGAGTEGMVITANPPSTTVTWPAWAPDGTENNNGDRHCDGCTFDLKDTTLTIELSKKSPKLSLSHTVENIKTWIVRWKRNHTIAADTVSSSDLYRNDETGLLTFNFSIAATGLWKNAGNNERFKLEFNLSNNWGVGISNPNWNASSGLHQWWSKWFGNALPGLPKGMVDVTVALPDLHTDFKAIDYFLETNLLFPGQHVFQPGSIPDGLYFPHDFVVTGNVQKK